MSDKELIIQLQNELRQHNYSYYVLDEPTISDYDFDIKLTITKFRTSISRAANI